VVGHNYPDAWERLRSEVINNHLNRCVNCHQVGGDSLEVHHIVPVGQAGTHRQSNLVPLCSRCHQAAHGEWMAPRIRWYTNDDLSNVEFHSHKRLWKEMRERLGVPRFDSDEDCVYIPIADKDRILRQMPA